MSAAASLHFGVFALRGQEFPLASSQSLGHSGVQGGFCGFSLSRTAPKPTWLSLCAPRPLFIDANLLFFSPGLFHAMIQLLF